jgi:hypothetical protein
MTSAADRERCRLGKGQETAPNKQESFGEVFIADLLRCPLILIKEILKFVKTTYVSSVLGRALGPN